MFVRPAPCAYVRPKRGLLRVDHADIYITRVFSRGSLDRPVQDVAELYRPVIAQTEQIQCGDPRERAYFVKNGCSPVEKETLDHVERGRTEFLEYAQPETLRDRRVDAVEGGVGPGAFDPVGAAFRMQSTLCLGKLDTGAAFRALEASR